MQLVEAIADTTVLDARGQTAYLIRGGVQYVLYDQEAAAALRDGVITLVAGLDRRLPHYTGEPLDGQRLILPFIGRLGDAIVTASCIGALKDRYPAVSVDIATPDAAREVFELMPSVGHLHPYPIDDACLDDFDYYLSFEHIEAVSRGDARSYADVFSRCLYTPRPNAPARISVPAHVEDRWALSSCARPRAAIHVGLRESLRSYPEDMVDELIRRLVEEQFDVYLVGAGNASQRVSDTDRSGVHDLTGRTPSPADLAAVLRQVNVLVTGDSFPLHLAGALGIPTIALFTATDRIIGTDYPSVTSLQSKAECSPCRVADGACPLGHVECVAHRDSSFAPVSIADLAGSIVTAAGTMPESHRADRALR